MSTLQETIYRNDSVSFNLHEFRLTSINYDLKVCFINNFSLDSIALAVDTGISEIIITGDLNLNFLSSPTRRKIEALCTQFMLFQSITQPTHFTETSSSLIDLILVSNKDHLVISGVGDPFLHPEIF